MSKFLDKDGALYYWQKIKALLAGKVDKVDGKGLSTNDYTTADKNKLSGIASGANKTTVVNALNSDSTTSALSAAKGAELNAKIIAEVAKINMDIEGLGHGGIQNNLTSDSTTDSLSAAQGKALNAKIANVKAEMLLAAHPVGSIYMSLDPTSPATLFGGTWERIIGVFLAAANDDIDRFKAGATGGQEYTTLTTANLPAHNHTVPISNILSGSAKATRAALKYADANSTSGWFDASNGGFVGNTGSGQSFRTVPPYLSVYTWKRTA